MGCGASKHAPIAQLQPASKAASRNGLVESGVSSNFNSSGADGDGDSVESQVMLSYRIIDTGARELGGDETVFTIQRALQAHGYSVFVGEAALQGGQRWGQRVQAAINNCEVFVALCSSDYGNTGWTVREFQLADFNRKPILPVWHSGQYPPVALEMFLSGLQRVPQGDWCLKEMDFDACRRQLVSGLQRQGCHPRHPPGGAPTPAASSSAPASGPASTSGSAPASVSGLPAGARSIAHPRPGTSLPPLAPLALASQSSAARATPSPPPAPPPPAPLSLRDPSYQTREGARAQAARTPDERFLLQAVDAGDAAAVARALGDPRVNPNVTGGPAGRTALALAAEAGDEGVVEALLRGGADPTMEDDYGKTPLHLACAKGHRGVVLLLLKAGADPAARASAGVSPLMDACRSGAAEVVELVLRGGADPCDADDAGRSALHYAGSGAVAQALLRAGADTAARDKESGATPLMAACRWADLEVASVLLGAGADLSARDTAGRTALHHAATPQVAEALLLAGADHGGRDNDGCTPLHAACSTGLAGVARALLEAGADKSAVDDWVKTPLALAKQRGHLEVAALLEDWER